MCLNNAPSLACFHLSLQKRNTSITYSSSLKELLQRKIDALEEQLHHHTDGHGGPDHHDDDSSHGDDREHHTDDHHDDGHPGDHKDDRHDDGHRNGHVDSDGGHTEHHDDGHNDDHHDADADHDDDDGGDHHDNEADNHSYLPHTGYRAPGPRTGFHSNKLETMFNQLHLSGTLFSKTAF